MAFTNAVSRKELGPIGASRFDAEAFGEADLTMERQLLSDGGQLLSTLLAHKKVKVLGRATLEPDGETNYLSISSVDAQDGFAFPDQLPNGLLPDRARWCVADGDILVSQVRPERGAVSLVTPDLAGAVASSGFYAVPGSALEPRLAAVLYLYLRSNIARRQLVRRTRNSMYPAVLAQDVENIIIPSFASPVLDEALACVARIKAARKSLGDLRNQLTALIDVLLLGVGSPPSPFESAKSVDSRAISWSDAFGSAGAARVDAEFYRSEYSDYDETISATPHFRLEEYFDVFSGTRVDGTDLVPVFKQSLLTNYGPNFSAVELEKAKASKGTRVQVGDVLLASTAHEIAYVGKKVEQIRHIPPELTENQAVAELMIIRPRRDVTSPVSSSFIVDFLRHTAGRHQVQRCIRGLRGGHTYSRDIKHYVLIPMPSAEWMTEYERIAGETDAARQSCVQETTSGIEALEHALGF